MAKKAKEQDSLMDAVIRGFKSAGIKDAGETVTTLAKYWENMKYIDCCINSKERG